VGSAQAGRDAAARRADPPAPDFRVHIERVEVVVPPATQRVPPRKAARPAPLSLDAYLRAKG
jgi:hypothetical protein